MTFEPKTFTVNGTEVSIGKNKDGETPHIIIHTARELADVAPLLERLAAEIRKNTYSIKATSNLNPQTQEIIKGRKYFAKLPDGTIYMGAYQTIDDCDVYFAAWPGFLPRRASRIEASDLAGLMHSENMNTHGHTDWKLGNFGAAAKISEAIEKGVIQAPENSKLSGFWVAEQDGDHGYIRFFNTNIEPRFKRLTPETTSRSVWNEEFVIGIRKLAEMSFNH